MDNFMKLEFAARSENESFARVAVASFVSQLDPTLEEISDIKTVVSEAVTNAIIHGYDQQAEGTVIIHLRFENATLHMVIEDHGRGIADLDQARQPLYTSKPEMERSGMGFTIIENFMDDLHIESEIGKGTKLIVKKTLQSQNAILN